MSKLFKKKIQIADSTKISLIDEKIVVEGKLGKNTVHNCEEIKFVRENSIISFDVEAVKDRVNAATFISNLENAVIGVETGFKKIINLVGVGYKVAKTSDMLTFNVGFSHPVLISIDPIINVVIEGTTKMILTSVDCIKLGDFCRYIVRKTRKVEPYKGKGVIIDGQLILRKEGKKK